MPVVKATIEQAIKGSINNNPGGEDGINTFAADLAKIIYDAIQTGTVTILNTELVTKVVSTAPGSPVVCTVPLTGSIQ